MSVEKSIFIRIPPKATDEIIDLAIRASAALARAKKLPPGDRTEALRFESLHSAIDQIAIAALAAGEPHETKDDSAEDRVGPSVFGQGLENPELPTGMAASWINEGAAVVELRLPHFSGSMVLNGELGRGPPPPATRWSSSTQRTRDAVQERFEFLLEKAVIGGGSPDVRAALCPSGISNRALTEGLRSYTHRTAEQQRIDIPVQYRDGSKGKPFPLRSLMLTDQIPVGSKILRFALMSIRHVDMDAVVDGAWLRNVKISRSRAAGLTDEIVFETSLRQLRRIASDKHTVIHLYQTGLETAIVGFYRALVQQLIDAPRSISVVPYYYHDSGEFVEGRPWTT